MIRVGCFSLLYFFPILAYSQYEKPTYWNSFSQIEIPVYKIHSDSAIVKSLEKQEGTSHIVSYSQVAHIEFKEFKLSKILLNGDKVYTYSIESKSAKGLKLKINHLKDNIGVLWIYNSQRTNFKKYNLNQVKSRDYLITHTIEGDKIILEYIQPKEEIVTKFSLSKIYQFFRGIHASGGFGTSQSCMINSACPEGEDYYQENPATCKIHIISPNYTGFCTGTLLNNTNEDGRPLILTANHCLGELDPNDLKDWEFHFLYHSSGCDNPSKEPMPLILKGARLLARSRTEGGDMSSDFLLLELLDPLPQGFKFTLLGWDRTDTPANGGICFHHPDGDIKKVSTYTGSQISSFKGLVPNTHLSATWVQTMSGTSVTEGGSSGAGLINHEKLLVGTLTGGGSFCEPQNLGPDYFGRLAYHWNQYGQANDQRVDIWLDPKGNGIATKLRTIRDRKSVV